MTTLQQKFDQHVAQWSTCIKCPLCETRNKVVLSRGKLPCDVLFIGEAPGESENRRGIPFVGEAGYMLRDLLNIVWEELGKEPRFAVTNILACVPRDDCDEIRPPTKKEAEACRPRLTEYMRLAQPKLVVLLGKSAGKYYPPENEFQSIRRIQVTHPSAFLRNQDTGASSTIVGQKKFILDITQAIRAL